MGNIFNTFSYKKEHINIKKIQKFEKVTSRVKVVTKLHCAYHSPGRL
jgi:hypothetical protein